MVSIQSSTTSQNYNIPPPRLFEWLYVICSLWFLSGLYSDAWAHTHIPDQETFFSFHHLILYSGATSLSVLIFVIIFHNYKTIKNFKKSIPFGYMPGFMGIVVFMAGGLGDMIWHELFGIENDLEAAFSPTHLLLMLGIQLFLVAPFYAAWISGEDNSGKFLQQLPKILSFGFLLSGLMVITQWAHPFVVIYATQPREFGSEAVGILSFFIQAVLLMGLVLLSLKERMLPVGAYTLTLTINAVALTLMRDNFAFIPIAVIAGIIIDLFVFFNFEPKTLIRFTATIVPVVYFSLYFIILSVISDITWPMHLIAGGVAMGTAASLLISIFILPPERSTTFS